MVEGAPRRPSLPADLDKKQAVAAVSPGQSSYYGMTIYARRLVFVVDISGGLPARESRPPAGSCSGPPLPACRRRAAFSIVAFSNHVGVWRPALVPATPATKEAAPAYVYGLRAGGETAASDALDAAFHFDAEAVFFLTDGQPNAGRIPLPAGILTTLTQANRARRISLFTIGIAPGMPGGTFDTFLSRLAEQNWGSYRRVEEGQ